MDKAIITPTFSSASFFLVTVVLFVTLLPGCVTQKYENDTPVVQNQANRDEMAATRISLGLGYLKMGNMAQAKLNLEKAKKFSPELVQVYTAFAHYYEVVGENELTRQSYEKALSIQADDADTLNNYGVFLCRQKDVPAAEIQFLRAIAVPSYLLVAQSYENLASCYLQIDDFAKAEQYLNKAIDHSPNRTATLLQMVRLQYAMSEYGQAKRYQQKFERHTRRFTPDSLALAYKVYWKLGQRRTAKNYGAMLVKMYPQSWESKQYLLNDLELIEADNLAKRYQITQRRLGSESQTVNGKSKKRIVKLSPKSKASAAAVASLAVIKGADSSKNVAKVNEATVASEATSATEVATVATKENIADTSQIQHETITAAKVKPNATTDNSILATTSGVDAAMVSVVLVDDSLTSGNDKTPNEVDNEEVIVAQSVDGGTETETETNAVELNAAANADINAALTSTALASDELVEPAATQVEIDSLTGTLTHVSPESQGQNSKLSELATGEPNSTMPIPAKRDAPLPEAVDFVAVETIEEDVQENTEQELSQDDVEGNIEGDNSALAEENVELNNEQAVDNSITAVPDEVIDEVVVVDVESDTLATESQPIYHQVSDGETLYAISVKYNVKIKALRKWNKITAKHKLQIKEKLYVVNPETVTNIND